MATTNEHIPSPLPTYLYKILPGAPPSPLSERLPLSDLDRNDGYLHLSTSRQVPGTAEKFFASYAELYLLRIKYDVLAAGIDGDGSKGKGEIKWEEVKGRQDWFAHYYGADLGSGNVDGVMKVERGSGWEALELAW